ncbi:MAG: response regulator [Lachnospiraceae bacterium]
MFKVLLVDDEALARESISKNIKWQELGLELVGTNRNGADALTSIEEKQPDIVLTDICMPYMDGMELSKRLFEDYPQIKIIIFSGYDEFEYAKKAVKYKVFEYMLKPVTARELTDVLKRVRIELEKQRLEKAQLKKMESEYHKTLPLVKGKVLMNLMLGNSEEIESSRGLEELGLTIHTCNMKVAYVHISNKGERLDGNNSALMHFIIYNIVSEIVEKDEEGICFQNLDQQIYIIFHTNHPHGLDNRIFDICTEIQVQIMQRLHLDVTVGLGCLVHTFEQLIQSFLGAQNAMDCQYSIGTNAIIDISKVKINQFVAVESIINEFIIAVKAGEANRLASISKNFYEMLRNACLTKSKAMTYIQMLLTSVSNEVQEYKEIGLEKPDVILDKIRSMETLEGAMQRLEEFLTSLCKKQKERCEGVNTRIALLALDYIEKNYANPDINLNAVCSYLSISQSYFSTIFKNYTGETFVDSLTKKRMKRAKDLLIHTDLRNYEIAERVGYKDPHYFSILFKKVTGYTPKVYARLHRKE